MALPALLRKLFKSSGYGSELNDGIISKIISNQDWSNSYDYPVGVVARGSDGGLYYSVAQSGPGTSAGAKDPAQGGNSGFWKSFGSGDSIPTGTVLWLSTTTVPAGYLLCNGAAVGRATYPELFTAIGTTYGSGDGSTTFNLPNLIDKFAEGSTVAGTVKAAGLPNITGTFAVEGVGGSNITGAFQFEDTVSAPGAADHDNNAYKNSFDASRSSAIYGASSTVQPPALTLLPCIKAFSSVVGDATVIAGQLVNDIQSKVALDGSNLSGAAVRAVVETWHSGTEWYRVWSDGWIEQGGYVASSLGPNLTLNLNKAFTSTNYFITASIMLTTAFGGSNSTADILTAVGVSSNFNSRTTTTVKISMALYDNAAYGYGPKIWYACGF